MIKFHLRCFILLAVVFFISFTSVLAQGTLLFREDFGGNAPTDPMTSPIGIGHKSEYIHETDVSYSTFGNNKYVITKAIPDEMRNPSWVAIDDHTSWGDRSRGYCFLVNGDTQKKVYELELDGLCSDAQLHFSFWAANICKKGRNLVLPDLEFVITDMVGNVVTSFRTGTTIPEEESLTWKQYGLNITVPPSITKLLFKINSYGNGGSGNDYVVDDIEVRLTTPSVSTTANNNLITDIVIADDAQTVQLKSTYIVDNTFGANLTSYWLYSETGNVASVSDWTPIDQKIATATVGLAWSHDLNLVNAKEGYYRMVVSSPANVLSTLCRAASNSIRIHK